jgi:hypothetical protein
MLEKVNVPEDDVAYQDAETRPVWADAQVELAEGWYGGGPPRPEDRQTRLHVELIIRREVGGKRQWGPVTWLPLLPPKAIAAAATTQTDDPVLLRPVALEISRPGVPTARRDDSALTHARGSWPAWPTLGDVAQALHQATGVEILADSFVRCRVDPKLVSTHQPVVHLLDALARELDYTWQQEGHLLLLRSRSYYRDRALEVPDRVLRPWQARAARAGAAPLDNLAELAAALDDHQTLGMSMCWGWYLEEPWIAPPAGFAFNFHRWRHQLRFWANVNPAQRQQALSGAMIPTESMNAAQRRAFVTALMDPDASPWDTGAAFLLSRRTLTPAEALPGGFSMKTAEWRLQLFSGEKPGETTQIIARYPSDRPPILSNLPHGYQWSESGTPSQLEICTFAYYLAGERKPARTVNVEVLGPRSAP